MMIVWKDVVGYENLYEVSNMGDVKRKSKEVFLSQFKVGNYIAVRLSKNSIATTKYVHHLLAESFYGHIINRQIVIDHIDNDKNNNKLENLNIITSRENSSKDKKNKTSKFTGVCWSSSHNKWMAYIRIGNKLKYLGYFNDELIASKAYLTALESL